MFDLMNLYERSNIKPSVVQQRFYANTKYDIGLRKFCAEKGIIYQSFWSLTANPKLVASAPVKQLVKELNITPQSALYCLILDLGHIVALNGTINVQHMKEDWNAVLLARDFATVNGSAWDAMMKAFKHVIGQPF